MSCPFCGAQQTWNEVRFGKVFLCEECRSSLRIPRSYERLILYPTLGSSIMLAVMAATEWQTRILVALLALVPINLIIGTILRHLWPPELELVDPDLQRPLGSDPGDL
jgi:hypothetical protein